MDFFGSPVKPVHPSWNLFDCIKPIGLQMITIILKYSCYKLNVCVPRLSPPPPTKFICWKLTPSVMVFGSEVFGDYIMRVQPLWIALMPSLMRPRELPWLLLLCEDTVRRGPLWTRKQISPDTRSADIWILDFLASRLWDVNFCCL